MPDLASPYPHRAAFGIGRRVPRPGMLQRRKCALPHENRRSVAAALVERVAMITALLECGTVRAAM